MGTPIKQSAESEVMALWAAEQRPQNRELEPGGPEETAGDPLEEKPVVRGIAFNHPTLVRNIEARQEAQRVYMPYLTLSQDGPLSYGSAADSACRLAVLTQLDAEARGELVVDPENPPPLGASSGHEGSYANGGCIYRFSVGEFPEHDRMQELEREFSNDIPLAELPLAEVIERVERALSYSTK